MRHTRFSDSILLTAPYVDASMTATAALILQQATGGVGGEASEEVIAKAEVAATIAADTVVRQSNEETIEQAKETAEAAAAAVVEEMMASVKIKSMQLQRSKRKRLLKRVKNQAPKSLRKK